MAWHTIRDETNPVCHIQHFAQTAITCGHWASQLEGQCRSHLPAFTYQLIARSVTLSSIPAWFRFIWHAEPSEKAGAVSDGAT